MSFIKVDVLVKYSSQKKKFRKIRLNFDATNDSEKMLIFNICRRGLMPNLIKKSWTVSIKGIKLSMYQLLSQFTFLTKLHIQRDLSAFSHVSGSF